MSVQTRINRWRRIAWVNESQYDNDDALQDFNIRYKRVAQVLLNKTWTKHFWDYWKADTVTGQYEYKVDELQPNTLSDPVLIIDKIDRILLKSWDGYLPMNRLVDSDYSDSQLANLATPSYTIRDKSIFIYPTPTEDITEWLKFEVESQPADLELTDVTDDIKIPSQYHYILDYWIAADALLMERKYNEFNVFDNLFEKWIKSISRWIRRTKSPVEVTTN